MLLTEYDEAKAMELFREDGRREGLRMGRLEGMRMGRLEGMREGIREGMHKGAIATLRALVEGGLIAVSDAAAQAGMTVDEFERAASELTMA